MKIEQAHAKALYLKILHEDHQELSKLNQSQRKLCLKVIEALANPQKTIEVKLPRKITYEQTIEKLSDKLESLPNKPSLRLIRLLVSLCKGILNRLSLRVSSMELERKIETLSMEFSYLNWYEYFNEYCLCIETSPKVPEIIFLGDTHNDHRQKKIRTTVMAIAIKILFEGQNILLLKEGACIRYQSNLLTWDTWERGSHHQEVIDVIEKQLKIDNEIERLTKKDFWSADKRMKYIRPLIHEKARLQIKENELNRLRDLDLIETIKEKIASHPKTKIFVIAGTSHLYREGFDIRSHFPDKKCALIIPKTRKLSHKMLPHIWDKMVKQGKFAWDL